MEFWSESGLTGKTRETTRRQWHVVRGAMDGSSQAETVCQCETGADWMPKPWLECNERAARSQEGGCLLKARSERPLKGDVMQHSAIEHNVERLRDQL